MHVLYMFPAYYVENDCGYKKKHSWNTYEIDYEAAWGHSTCDGGM